MTSHIREIGPELVRNGYAVVELAPGKKCPLRKKWQETPLSEQACRQHPPEEGVGILCGYGDNPVCAVDVDFCGTEEEASRLFDALCAVVPDCLSAVYRVGRAPKFALLFRAEGRWTKQVTKFYMRGGDRATRSRLEILGKGQQLAVYHTHPDTKLPYAYPNAELSGEPSTVPVAGLPLLTYRGVQLLCDAFVNFMDENGWSADPDSSARTAIDADEDDFTRTMPKAPVGLSEADIRRLMRKRVPQWGDYHQWFVDGMRIHHETGGSAEGLVLWDELSREAPGYDGFESVERKWRSFSDKGQSSATMWPLARDDRMIVGRAAEFTEDGLMCRVLRDWGECIRYAPVSKKWFYFEPSNGRWDYLGPAASVCTRFRNEVLNGTLTAEVQAALAEGNEARAKAAKKFQMRCLDSVCASQERLLKSISRLREIHIDENDLNRKSGYIAVKNGLVNLTTGDLEPNTPDALMTQFCDVEYDPTADCPTWRRCVGDWFESEEVARYMQKVLGKMLDGQKDDESFFLLLGDGANGKTSFLTTIGDVMGGYSKSVGDETLVGRKSTAGGGTRSDIVRLVGARFAYCSETGSGESFRAADLKRISGGDRISARGLYAESATEFDPQFTLFIATNFAPNMQGADNAMRRRIRLVKFPHDFEYNPTYAARRIRGLRALLESERAGIFNWMLEGYAMYRKEGLTPPKSVVTASNEYVDSHDLTAQWFEECVEVGAPKAGERPPTTKELFEAYLRWLGSMNEQTQCERQRGFVERLKKLLDRKLIRYEMGKSNGVRVFRGIRFRDKTEEPDDDFEILD